MIIPDRTEIRLQLNKQLFIKQIVDTAKYQQTDFQNLEQTFLSEINKSVKIRTVVNLVRCLHRTDRVAQ